MLVQTGYYASNNASVRAPTGLVHLSPNASGSAPTGFVHLSTTGSDAGSSTGTVAVTDGELMDQKSFSIEIRASTAPQIVLSNTLRMVRLASGDPTGFVSDDHGSPHSVAKIVDRENTRVTTIHR